MITKEKLKKIRKKLEAMEANQKTIMVWRDDDGSITYDGTRYKNIEELKKAENLEKALIHILEWQKNARLKH